MDNIWLNFVCSWLSHLVQNAQMNNFNVQAKYSWQLQQMFTSAVASPPCLGKKISFNASVPFMKLVHLDVYYDIAKIDRISISIESSGHKILKHIFQPDWATVPAWWAKMRNLQNSNELTSFMKIVYPDGSYNISNIGDFWISIESSEKRTPDDNNSSSIKASPMRTSSTHMKNFLHEICSSMCLVYCVQMGWNLDKYWMLTELNTVVWWKAMSVNRACI